MRQAVISHLQHFSVGDGPGIRTTLFFKGCNLHCPWCHNPETIHSAPELMFYSALCTGCGRCAGKCTCHQIPLQGRHVFTREVCTACGECASLCPSEALVLCGKQRTVEEIMIEIRKDRDFYAASGGGVTLSGGEALLQAEACAAIAAACQKEGISVLLDTAGNTHYSAFERLLPFLNLCYFDLKSGTQAGYQTVGGSLNRTLENMSRLIADGVKTEVRIPIIPGFNDTLDDARRMADIIAQAGVKEVGLLPFHRFGSGKYEALARKYGYADICPPSQEKLEALLEIFRSGKFLVHVGG